MSREKSFITALFLLSVIFFWSNPSSAAAAALSMSPSYGSYAVGDSIMVTMLVSSDGKAINAVAGTISFSKDTLEALSLSTAGSVISLWVQDPTVFNGTGRVNFEGIILNPGFSGSSGKIITVTFKVKAPGSASVKFLTGSVLANDGAGTNLLESTGGAEFVLVDSSPVALISGSDPPEASCPSCVSGLSYRERPPFFDIRIVEREDLTEPKVRFVITAVERQSSVDYYEMQLDYSDPEVWYDDGDHVYETPILAPGTHTLFVKAVDKAGNSLVNYTQFAIESLRQPTDLVFSRELLVGEILIVKGNTYPGVKVILWLQDEEGETYDTIGLSDENGEFTSVYVKKLDGGIYKMWLEIIDDRGARSDASLASAIVIRPATFLRLFAGETRLSPGVVVTAAGLITLLLLLFVYFRKKEMLKKK